MPTYQYACTECGHGFEVVQSFTDDALTECGECAGRLRKVFSSVGIVFKGSGFYRNDSREAAKSATETKDAAKERKDGKDVKADKGDRADKGSERKAPDSPAAGGGTPKPGSSDSSPAKKPAPASSSSSSSSSSPSSTSSKAGSAA